jgi:hypothetical protein
MQKKVSGATGDSRWILFSGLVFVAAWIVGLALVSAPAATSSAADLFTFYREQGLLAMWQAYVANGLTGVALLVFVSALCSVLRRLEGEDSPLLRLLFAAGIVVSSLSCLEALFTQVLANSIAALGDVAALRTLLELNGQIDTYKLLVLGMMIGIASLLAWRVRAFPFWLAWGGAIVCFLLVIASFGSLVKSEVFTIVLYISGIGLLLWVATASILMGWQGRAASQSQR